MEAPNGFFNPLNVLRQKWAPPIKHLECFHQKENQCQSSKNHDIAPIKVQLSTFYATVYLIQNSKLSDLVESTKTSAHLWAQYSWNKSPPPSYILNRITKILKQKLKAVTVDTWTCWWWRIIASHMFQRVNRFWRGWPILAMAVIMYMV